jgi:haloalkane dehalogenase
MLPRSVRVCAAIALTLAVASMGCSDDGDASTSTVGTAVESSATAAAAPGPAPGSTDATPTVASTVPPVADSAPPASGCTVPDADDTLVAEIESQSGIVASHPMYGDVLRTPADRFANLPGYPFASHYVDVDDDGAASLYMHYIDEGPRDGRVVLMLHGNPAWSYLVRDHVAPLVDAGYRVIALDLVGFGKSDKPAGREHQNFANQTRWVENFVDRLNLCDTTMFGQDWGGMIAARVAMSTRERFSGVVISNAGLADGTLAEDPSFVEWRDVISQQMQNFSQALDLSTPTDLTAAELAAYDAPFPGNEYTAGPRQLPSEVPFDASLPETMINIETLGQWAQSDLPLLTVFSDPVTGAEQYTVAQRILIEAAAGAAGQPHVNLDPAVAGHFISEDAPNEVTQHLLDFIGSTG